jgi:hypothetical protein
MERPLPRRNVMRAGMAGILGSSCIAAAKEPSSRRSSQAVIFIFLSGGLAQHESFDPKPDGPLDIRGEFGTIATRTPGLRLCEHLPMLAERSQQWALCRSLSHSSNEHSAGHQIMLSGRSNLPVGFDANRPKHTDWPAIAALAANAMPAEQTLPSSIVLPEKLVHRTGRSIPGQFAGLLGRQKEPWWLECSPYFPAGYGAYPTHAFHHASGGLTGGSPMFRPLNLALPEGLAAGRLISRVELRNTLESRRPELGATAEAGSFDRYRGMATALLLDPGIATAFDLSRASPRQRERYGENSFGWSLLLAARLVRAGVSFVQVNLGNNETWDTHQSAWTNLKQFLLPPMDRAVSALIDDLAGEGRLETTLVAMAGEFGRTPTISTLPGAREAGRDHWGRVQTAFFAGGGVRGGAVVGATDRFGGEPDRDPQRPEDFAATLFRGLGLAAHTVWQDESGRPFPLTDGRPIAELFAG